MVDVSKTTWATTQKQWFPVSIAEAAIKQQTTLNATYKTNLATYDAAKKKYNDAIATPAKKPDFFTSLFNPPKASTVPTRPDLKTQNVANYPGAYTGYYQQPFVGKTNYGIDKIGKPGTTDKNALAANQFVVTAGHGGWGGFTMGFLMPAAAMYHSFGMMGSDTAATAGLLAEAGSYMLDKKGMCQGATDSAKAAAGTYFGFCQAGGTANSGGGPFAAAASAYTNDKLQYVAVSVWA